MTHIYFQVCDLQEQLIRLWAGIGRPTAAEFAQERASIPAEAAELARELDRLEAIVTFGADGPMTAARRRELLSVSAGGRAVLTDEGEVTFTAARSGSVMSAAKRRELLGETLLGREVLAEEDATAAAASFSETLDTPASTDPKARRRAEECAVTLNDNLTALTDQAAALRTQISAYTIDGDIVADGRRSEQARLPRSPDCARHARRCADRSAGPGRPRGV